jgi:lysophospholipase L1-like esterase
MTNRARSGDALFGYAVLLSLGTAAGLLVAEAGVRLDAALNPRLAQQLHEWDPLAVSIEPHGDFGYRQRPNHMFRYANGTAATSNAMGFRGPLVAVPKLAGTFRIVLLGESTTHGWSVNDDETIDAYMRQLLARRYARSSFEVVNVAFDGYDSYQLFERLRTDGLRLEPDLLIVNAGINDVRNAKFPNLQDHDARTLLYSGVLRAQRQILQLGHPTVWTRIKHLLYLARLPGIIRGQLATRRATSKAPDRGALEYFARNLRRIADLVADRRIPVLFSTPPSALTTRFAPHDTSSISYWIGDATTTQQYRDALAGVMQQVAAQLRREGRSGDYVHPQLPPSVFLDDCHLAPEGNRLMARSFVAAIDRYLIADQAEASRSDGPVARAQ